MVSAVTRASRHYRHHLPEQSPAPRVTYVTNDANDARRGVTREVTRDRREKFASPVRVTILCPSGGRETPLGDANDARRGHPLPPPFWNKWGLPAPRPPRALPREHPLFASPASSPQEGAERSHHVLPSPRAREERHS